MALIQENTARYNEQDCTHRPERKLLDALESQGPVSTQSNPALLDRAYPYTEKFFSDLAVTILYTFPFKRFAKENGCQVRDVVHAIRTTVIDPLLKPSAIKDSKLPTAMRTTEATQDAESTNDTIVSMNPTAAVVTSSKSPERRRGGKRRKTMAPRERQLVKREVYGNYVPIRSQKDASHQFPQN
ncbi:hypothetical protein BJX76DRAFT_230783 [Aspergillus varians]